MRPAARIISSAGACSPSSQPRERATPPLVVARARQPSTFASATALATSHAFGRTRMGGFRWYCRRRFAFSIWSMCRGYRVDLARLPQLDPIALRIDDPTEATHALHLLRLVGYVCPLAPQLRKHRVEVANPEVEHGLLLVRSEVAGPGLERCKHRRAGFRIPQTVLVCVQPEAVSVPRPECRRVGGAQEVPTYADHAFHAPDRTTPRPR